MKAISKKFHEATVLCDRTKLQKPDVFSLHRIYLTKSESSNISLSIKPLFTELSDEIHLLDGKAIKWEIPEIVL